jgi:hypothetical protein
LLFLLLINNVNPSVLHFRQFHFILKYSFVISIFASSTSLLGNLRPQLRHSNIVISCYSNSNSATVQWKKFVNEAIGISLEYPSNWEEKRFMEDYFYLEPKLEAFPLGEYPWGTHFRFDSTGKSYDNLDVMTRVLAVYVLDLLTRIGTMK